MNITKIPIEELVDDLNAARADATWCDMAIGIGVYTYQDRHNGQQHSVTDRLSENLAVIAKIQAEITRRTGIG